MKKYIIWYNGKITRGLFEGYVLNGPDRMVYDDPEDALNHFITYANDFEGITSLCLEEFYPTKPVDIHPNSEWRGVDGYKWGWLKTTLLEVDTFKEKNIPSSSSKPEAVK